MPKLISKLIYYQNNKIKLIINIFQNVMSFDNFQYISYIIFILILNRNIDIVQ